MNVRNRLATIVHMSTLTDIEQAIEQLPPEEFQAQRAWFIARDAAEWDRQFEADVAAGKLDGMVAEAILPFSSRR